MKPFRYLTDVAYVVPALRRHTAWPPMNRRKTAIVIAVLGVHAALIWALVAATVAPPPPIEFVETQVVLERITPDNPVPTPIPPSPQVRQKIERQQQATPQRQRPQPTRRVNEAAAIKEVEQEPVQNLAQELNPARQQPQAQPTPVAPPPKAIQTASENVAKPAAPAVLATCNKASPLIISSSLVTRKKDVKVVVRRSASMITSASLQSSTGNYILDGLIKRAARGLELTSKDAACAGQSFTITAQLRE